MSDVQKFYIADISKEIAARETPIWTIAQEAKFYGRDLTELENNVASELGISWPDFFGEPMQGIYEQEQDCADVAVGMMRKKPELLLSVTCSDPNWRPSCSPVAYIVESSGIPEVDHAVRRQIARDIRHSVDRALLGAMTSTVESEPITFDLGKMLADCERLMRNARREQLIVIVDMALSPDTPLLMEQTPCDGHRIEMSYRQAQELHGHWPLKLHNVLSRERAEFVPVSGVFPDWFLPDLPAPPYVLPTED